MINTKKIKGLNVADWDKRTATIAGSGPGWLSELRQAGLSRFTESGIPTTKDEEWKYTNVVALAERKFSFAAKGDLFEKKEFARYCSDDDINLVFVNGYLSEDLSNLRDIPAGVNISTLQEAIRQGDTAVQEHLTRYETGSTNPFTALNQALCDDMPYIKVADKTVSKKLIHIVHVASFKGKDILLTPRNLIVLGKQSEANIMISHISFNDDLSYLASSLTDIFLDEQAVLFFCKAQDESQNAFHIGTTRVWQERDSNFQGFSQMTGGLVTRNNLDVIINGEGANATLDGLYCVNKKQHVDNHTSVDHRFPNCTSNQLYKGLLNGAARSVFNGKIFVKAIAQKTNSYQLNKNLLLGTDCRVDTKPQLEIFADDVKCTHGATIGQLNEDEIFYLQTRTIPRKRAINMLSHGFVDDILNTIASDSVRSKLHILLEPTFAALE